MKVLSFLDIFSQTPGLKINKSEKYFTIFGLIISLITVMCIVATFIYYTYLCISRKNYKILERFDNNLIPSFNISENKIGLIVMDLNGKDFKDADKLYSIEAEFREIDASIEKENIIQLQNIPVTNCSIYINEPFKSEAIRLMQRWPFSKCLDFRSLKKDLYGKYGSLTG